MPNSHRSHTYAKITIHIGWDRTRDEWDVILNAKAARNSEKFINIKWVVLYDDEGSKFNIGWILGITLIILWDLDFVSVAKLRLKFPWKLSTYQNDLRQKFTLFMLLKDRCRWRAETISFPVQITFHASKIYDDGEDWASSLKMSRKSSPEIFEWSFFFARVPT